MRDRTALMQSAARCGKFVPPRPSHHRHGKRLAGVDGGAWRRAWRRL